MIEVLFHDEQTPTPLTDLEVAFRKQLAGRKLRNGRYDYTDRYRAWCLEGRVAWAWTRVELRGPRLP